MIINKEKLLEQLENNVKKYLNYSKKKKEENKYKNAYLESYYEGKEAAYKSILLDILNCK